MADNLYPESGPEELRVPDRPEMPERADASRAPMADREVPLDGGHPALLVQQWLDGEATEAAARREEMHDVELWQRINEETERRRRMVTPAPVLGRIMAAIPAAATPAAPLSWWKRSTSLTNTGVMLAAAALIALGIVVGTLLR